MSTFANDTIASFAHCNFHACAYGALGAFLLIRAFVAIRERRYDQAREDVLVGLLHVALGLL